MIVTAVGVAAVGSAAVAYVQAANAADAAALAAAPVTFRPFGADGTPAQEAAAFAASNDAVLIRCDCHIDRSWRRRTVVVTIERRVEILGFGLARVRASSSATFAPAALIPAG